ncbi:MAG: uridine kinase [Patescibacteria group bacterium]
MQTFVVAVTGGTGSGKGYFARHLAERFPGQATVISMDMYYRDQSAVPFPERLETNVDNPKAFDFDKLAKDVAALRNNQPAEEPVYDYEQRIRLPQTTRLEPRPLLIVEGLLALHQKDLNETYDLKVYLETDADLRLARRLLRDIREKRHETLDYSINQYLTSARPSHKIFVEPQKKTADLVIDWNEFNQSAFDQVVDLIKKCSIRGLFVEKIGGVITE